MECKWMDWGGGGEWMNTGAVRVRVCQLGSDARTTSCTVRDESAGRLEARQAVWNGSMYRLLAAGLQQAGTRLTEVTLQQGKHKQVPPSAYTPHAQPGCSAEIGLAWLGVVGAGNCAVWLVCPRQRQTATLGRLALEADCDGCSQRFFLVAERPRRPAVQRCPFVVQRRYLGGKGGSG